MSLSIGYSQQQKDASVYPVDELIDRLSTFCQRWGLEVYLEPGTAVVLNAGALVAEVLDTGWNDGHFAVLDASATCHMPDVIEAPYTPDLLGGVTVESPTDTDARDDRVIRLGGPTCLAGDVIGTYRLEDRPKTVAPKPATGWSSWIRPITPW
jgi:carboxynorspermidine decarboxylase